MTNDTTHPEPTSAIDIAPAKNAVSRPVLSCDFDGVINSYVSGWEGADVVNDPPVDGAMRFLTDVSEKFEINIYSTRSGQPGGVGAMYDYIAKHLRRYWVDLPDVAEKVLSRIKFPTDKPKAKIILDDRAITFTGVFPELEELETFEPWHKK